jgi:hypothetical protein
VHVCGYGERFAQGHVHQPGHPVDERLAWCGDVCADVQHLHHGGLRLTWTCATTTLNAISFASPVVTVGLTGIRCLLAVPSWGCGTVSSAGITVTGSIHGTLNDTTQKLAVFSAGQGFTATATASCDGLTGFSGGGIAAATFGSTSAGTGNVTYSVTGSPSIWTS